MAYTTLSDLFKGICDAIRAKKGTTGTINHQDIPTEIAAIETGADVSGVTASASDVHPDKYFVNSSGTLTQGAMPNASIEVIKSTTSSFENYIQVNCSSAGYSKTGIWKYTNPTSLDSNLDAANIKNGEQIFNVIGTYTGDTHAVYLTDVEINAYDLDAGFSGVALGAANDGDILKYVSITKEGAAGDLELISLSADVVNKTGKLWYEDGGSVRYTITSSNFSGSDLTANIDVVDSTAYLNLFFTIDLASATDGDQFNILAVWGKA